MRAEHYTFATEHQAEDARHRFIRRGWTVSTPWRDEYGTWRVTVLFYGS
ncbi:MAG: hypothetical protein JJU36_11970 [Phycisphaeraceae bacterium]|nr:hypothetical protein [Phycisphaeraceae bacterium]